MLPMILGALGTGMAGTLGLSPLLAGALGSGLGQFVQTGDLKSAIGTGLGTYAGGSLMGGASNQALSAGQTLPAGQAPMTSPSPVARGMAPAGGTGIGGLMDTFKSGYNTLGTGGIMGGMLGGALMADTGGVDISKRTPKRIAREPYDREYTAPPEGYRPGIDPEHRYLQPIYRPSGYAETIRMHMGGLASIQPQNAMAPQGMSPQDVNRFPPQGMSPAGAMTPQNTMAPQATMSQYGGMGQGMAHQNPMAQGMMAPQATVAQNGMMAPQDMLNQRSTQMMAEGGLAGIAQEAAPVQAPQAPAGPPQDIKQAFTQLDDMQLVRATTMAVKGLLTDQEASLALGEFLRRNGEDKLKKLLKDVQDGKAEEFSRDEKGLVSGPGGGTDDLVPAMTVPEGAPLPPGAMSSQKDPYQPVLLSEGEVVTPAKDVKAMGNGDPEAGAEKLMQMTSRMANA